jgi:hypothetical protein
MKASWVLLAGLLAAPVLATPASAASAIDSPLAASVARLGDDVLAQRIVTTGPRRVVVTPGGRRVIVGPGGGARVVRRGPGAGAVAAGVAAGVVGGALVAGALAQPRGVYAEEPVYVAPRRRVVVEEGYGCRIVRRPVRDEWGEVIGFRRVEVC